MGKRAGKRSEIDWLHGLKDALEPLPLIYTMILRRKHRLSGVTDIKIGDDDDNNNRSPTQQIATNRATLNDHTHSPHADVSLLSSFDECRRFLMAARHRARVTREMKISIFIHNEMRHNGGERHFTLCLTLSLSPTLSHSLTIYGKSLSVRQCINPLSNHDFMHQICSILFRGFTVILFSIVPDRVSSRLSTIPAILINQDQILPLR